MKMFKKILSVFLCALVVLVSCLGAMSLTSANAEEAKPTVWLIGDSTVCSFTDAYYYPRYGYGTQIDKYLDGTYEVKNIALSGRSSKSYTADPQYQELCSGMKSGDVLIIGFGHNDEKTEADRYTNPNGDYMTEGSFANSLYKNYIEKAQAAGTQVILCTPIVRRNTTDTWSNSNLHITSDVEGFPGGNYPEAIIKLGKDLNIPVVDMTAKTKALYDTLGADTLYYHAWTSSKESSVDNTHTNIWGATYNAYMLMQEIKALNVEGISEHIISAEAPTKAATLVSNPAYKEVSYTPVAGTSELWPTVGAFKGTVFGNVGGAEKVSTEYYSLGGTLDALNIAIKKDSGKIASTADGIAMYYVKIPASSVFSLSATMTVNSFGNHDQISFGLMARDEMYLDKYLTETIGDYVVAGPLKLTKSGAQWNCFARKSGTLTQGGTMSSDVKAGDTVDLKIESTSDGYACTYGTEQTITGGFDFKLTSIDSDYVYVGMFACRKADVTFSNIKLTVDGKEMDITKELVFETSTNDPGNKPAEDPSNTPTQTPGETPTQAPAETPAETPAQTPAETPAQTPKTGDAAPVLPMVILLCASVLTFAAMRLSKREEN